MSKIDFNDGRYPKNSSVTVGGIRYLTDDNGYKTDVDVDYYKAMPGFNTFMKDEKIKNFTSKGDVATFNSWTEKQMKSSGSSGSPKTSTYKKTPVDKQLEKLSTNRGKDLTYKSINKIADRHDLSFEAVLGRAQNLQGMGTLKIDSNAIDRARNDGLIAAPTLSETLSDIPNYGDFMKEAGVDGDDLYKPYNQEQVLEKIDEWGQNTELFTPKSIKELQVRMPLNNRAKELQTEFDDKYGSRFEGNTLKFDKDGNEYKKIKEPVYKNLGEREIYGNKLKMDTARDQMKTFEQGGGFQPVNMTTKTARGYKNKGKNILKGIKI